MKLTYIVENSIIEGMGLKAEHGLSVLIETRHGNVLWDTGASSEVLENNLAALGLDDVPLTTLALSHSHRDHTGGMEAVLARYPGIDIFAEKTFFRPRYTTKPAVPELAGASRYHDRWMGMANWHLDTEPVEIVSGVMTTGTIKRHPYPLGSSPNHMINRKAGLGPDPYNDDISLVLKVEGGIVLQLGCCHAGLRNTLLAVREQYDEPLLAILGGTHLGQVAAEELDAIVANIEAEGRPRLYLNHCTGDKAFKVLQSAFGDLAQACPAGTVLEF